MLGSFRPIRVRVADLRGTELELRTGLERQIDELLVDVPYGAYRDPRSHRAWCSRCLGWYRWPVLLWPRSFSL